MHRDQTQFAQWPVQKSRSNPGSVLMRNAVETETSYTVALGNVLIDGVGSSTTRHARVKGCVKDGNMREGIVHGSGGYVVLYGFKHRICNDLRLIKFSTAVNHPVSHASNIVGFTFFEHTLNGFIVRLASGAVCHQSFMFA